MMARIISVIEEGGAPCTEVQARAILIVKIVAVRSSLRSSLRLTFFGFLGPFSLTLA